MKIKVSRLLQIFGIFSSSFLFFTTLGLILGVWVFPTQGHGAAELVGFFIGLIGGALFSILISSVLVFTVPPIKLKKLYFIFGIGTLLEFIAIFIFYQLYGW